MLLFLLVFFVTSQTFDQFSTHGLESNSVFDDTLINSRYFVDKSELVHELFANKPDSWTLVCAPPKFGKTTNIHMLKLFLGYEYDEKGQPKVSNQTKAYRVFKNLKISRHEELLERHLARHPVIHLELKFTIEGMATEEKVLMEIRDKVRQCYLEYEWLLDIIKSHDHPYHRYADVMEKAILGQLNLNSVVESVFMLGSILYQYFDKTQVIVLVDDYDYAVNDAFLSQKHTADYIHRLINNLLAFGKSHVFRSCGLIVGSSQLSYDLSHWIMNEIKAVHFLQQCGFVSYFGFTKTDMNELYDRYECSKAERDSIKRWYNGYLTSQHHHSIYNPYSVTRYFMLRATNQTIFRGYWSATQDPSIIGRFLENADLRYKLVQLLRHEFLFLHNKRLLTYEAIPLMPDVRVDEDQVADPSITDEVLRFFYEHGYLGYALSNEEEFMNYEYVLPNFEVQQLVCAALAYYHAERNIPMNEIGDLFREIFVSPDIHENFTFAEHLQATLQHTFEMAKTPHYSCYVPLLNRRVLEFHSILYVAAFQLQFEIPGVEVSVNDIYNIPERSEIFIKKHNVVLMIRINTEIDDKMYSPKASSGSKLDRKSNIFKFVCVNMNATEFRNVALMYGYKLPD